MLWSSRVHFQSTLPCTEAGPEQQIVLSWLFLYYIVFEVNEQPKLSLWAWVWLRRVFCQQLILQEEVTREKSVAPFGDEWPPPDSRWSSRCWGLLQRHVSAREKGGGIKWHSVLATSEKGNVTTVVSEIQRAAEVEKHQFVFFCTFVKMKKEESSSVCPPWRGFQCLLSSL